LVFEEVGDLAEGVKRVLGGQEHRAANSIRGDIIISDGKQCWTNIAKKYGRVQCQQSRGRGPPVIHAGVNELMEMGHR